MFKLNPFRKSTRFIKNEYKPVRPLNINKPIIQYSLFGCISTLAYFAREDEEIFDLLATSISPDIKSKAFKSFIQVHIGDDNFKINMPAVYDKGGFTGKLYLVESDTPDIIGFNLGHQFIYDRDNYYRHLTLIDQQKGDQVKLGLLYQEFERLQTPTIKSNFINSLIKNHFVSFDLFDPYVNSQKSNGFSVYTLVEAVFLASTTKINRKESLLSEGVVSFDTGYDTIPELTGIYKYALTKLRDLNQIKSRLEMTQEQFEALLSTLGYSIASRLIDYLKDNTLNQDFNRYYSLVKESSYQLDKITSKLYQDLVDNKPLEDQLKNHLITVLDHKSTSILEVMKELDSKDSTVKSNLNNTTEDWKAFLQFLNE